jgi:hypothetical protein
MLHQLMNFKTNLRRAGLVFVLILLGAAAFAQAQANEHCKAPQELAAALQEEYPRTRILRLADLVEENRTLYAKEHRGECPGYTPVNFYGDRQPTVAIVLVSPVVGTAREAKLVLAHKSQAGWRTVPLETMKDSLPVVWKMEPGTYRDVYKEKVVRAKNPVIVLCEYDSWAILYSWNEDHISKIWISD